MLKVRLESRVIPSSLTVLERVTKVPATSTHVMSPREELRWDAPRRIASNLSGFNASPLCENQE